MSARRQEGAALVVALILLALITLLVVNAYTLNASSLKAVGNMQVRDEALAAAEKALEQVIGTNFTNPVSAHAIGVDINQDGTADYQVAVAAPQCIRAVQAAGGAPSDLSLGAGLASGGNWRTDWELKAGVSDSVTGARGTVTAGVTVMLTQAEKAIACP